MQSPLFLGIDLGSSFIKLSLIDQSQTTIAETKVPKHELKIVSKYEGWAEQDPQIWWKQIKIGLHTLLDDPNVDRDCIQGIGLSYQMHGLVMVDQQGHSIGNSIIWCDSRATAIGEQLHDKFEKEGLSSKIMNHPSNFTLSKMVWVKRNSEEAWKKVSKIMLLGDYIAMKMSGQVQTTIQGLSEATLWDYSTNSLSKQALAAADISLQVIPQIVGNFAFQCNTNQQFNSEFGLFQSIPILYRSGDQPNNAFSLGVLHPGEVASTAGTSGVIYAVSSSLECEQLLRFNSFAHVIHTMQEPRIGKLLCINGCGIVYQWLRKNFLPTLTYEQINLIAETHESEGIVVIPFGNGAQRMLGNQDVGCHMLNINFNRHTRENIIRATVEGVAFSFVYGASIMREQQIQLAKMKAGRGNLFECPIFCDIISTLLDIEIDTYNTNGAEGAAKAALLGCLGMYNQEEAAKFQVLNNKVDEYVPSADRKQNYQKLYAKWVEKLETVLPK